MNRRKFLKSMAISGAVIAASPVIFENLKAHAEDGLNKRTLEEAMKDVLKGKKPVESEKVKLIAPSIAENGAVVPIKIDVAEPVENVIAIHVFAEKNPDPWTVSFYPTPQNGKAYFATRIRLAKTMDVLAVAELKDGSLIMAKKAVKVTIGGCG